MVTLSESYGNCIIPERTRYTDIRFKPIYGRARCYNNSFIPYTVKKMELIIPREVVNIECSDTVLVNVGPCSLLSRNP